MCCFAYLNIYIFGGAFLVLWKRYDGFFESKFLFQDGIFIPVTEVLKIVVSNHALVLAESTAFFSIFYDLSF